MNVIKPSIRIETVDCDCEEVIYAVTIDPGMGDIQTVEVNAPGILPLIGRCFELLNAHRLEEIKKAKELDNGTNHNEEG